MDFSPATFDELLELLGKRHRPANALDDGALVT